MTTTKRSGQGLLDRPMIKSPGQDLPRYAEVSSPLCDILSHSVVGDGAIVASVVGLGMRSCPSAILPRVGAIVVDPVESGSLRAFAHVGEEVLKVVPSRVPHDSAIGVSTSGSAPLAQEVPASPRGTVCQSVCSVTGQIGDTRFFSKAPTRTGITRGQATDRNFFLGATLASTEPERPQCFADLPGLNSFECSKPTERPSGQVFSLRHKSLPYQRMWSK